MLWDPFEDIKRIRQEIDRAFERVFRTTSFRDLSFREPLTDISEKGDEIIFRMEMPGVHKEDIDLRVTSNSIEVKAQRRDYKVKEKEGFYRRERSYKGYHAIRALPVKVIPEKVKATYENGVLTVRMKKAEKTKEKIKKKIKIQ